MPPRAIQRKILDHFYLREGFLAMFVFSQAFILLFSDAGTLFRTFRIGLLTCMGIGLVVLLVMRAKDRRALAALRDRYGDDRTGAVNA